MFLLPKLLLLAKRKSASKQIYHCQLSLAVKRFPSRINALAAIFTHDALSGPFHRYADTLCIDKAAFDPGGKVERQNLTMRMGMRRFNRLTTLFKEDQKPSRDDRAAVHAAQLLPS